MSSVFSHIQNHAVVSTSRPVWNFLHKKNLIRRGQQLALVEHYVHSKNLPRHNHARAASTFPATDSTPTNATRLKQHGKVRMSAMRTTLSGPRKLESHRGIARSPAEYLAHALRKAGYRLGDHGHSSLRSNEPGSPHRETAESLPTLSLVSVWPHTSKRPPRLSLQTILADYILHVEPLLPAQDYTLVEEQGDGPPGLELALKTVFCAKHLGYLSSRGYCVTDVVAWAWILRSRNAFQAILRTLCLEESYRAQHRPLTKTVPSFIFLLLLSQQKLDLETFRLLLVCAVQLMRGRTLPTVRTAGRAIPGNAESAGPPIAKSSLDFSVCITFITRLLHHARQLWPQAQLTIARELASYLKRSDSDEGLSEDAIRRRHSTRAEALNDLLCLLSLPSKPGPFASAAIKQQAQFELLRTMAAHKPILPISRRGYQGIVSVQLAHRKTAAERQSAELKAPSWPPWKEEKLGIDVHRGNQGMRSRAIQVMSQMRDAGYSHTLREEVSAIFAGWDTDNSPTIQTRAMLPSANVLTGPRGSQPDHEAIWVARIRATRTIREAWACFLSYRERSLPLSSRVYAAMAGKLILRQKAVNNHFDETNASLPGDGSEVFAEPTSARDLIYVATEPPTVEEFIKEMQSKGIRPSGWLLGRLLEIAPDFESGLRYLCFSDLSSRQIKVLTNIRPYLPPRELNLLKKIPESIFASFIAFLCKESNFESACSTERRPPLAELFPILIRGSKSPKTSLFARTGRTEAVDAPVSLAKALPHAANLLRLRKSQSYLPWRHLFKVVSRPRPSSGSRSAGLDIHHILAWYEVLHVAGWMKERGLDPGTDGFHCFCTSFTRAVARGVKNPNAVEEALTVVRESARRSNVYSPEVPLQSFEEMMRHGLHILKDEFNHLVSPGYSQHVKGTRAVLSISGPAGGVPISMPPMLHTPHPAVLHAFVRALGHAEDYDGLLNLLRWMSSSAETLKEAADEFLNGEKMFRRTLVAFRVFLEGTLQENLHAARHPRDQIWSDHASEASHNDIGSVLNDPHVQEAHDLIISSPVLSPWPSDEEVNDYVFSRWGVGA